MKSGAFSRSPGVGRPRARGPTPSSERRSAQHKRRPPVTGRSVAGGPRQYINRERIMKNATTGTIREIIGLIFVLTLVACSPEGRLSNGKGESGAEFDLEDLEKSLSGGQGSSGGGGAGAGS